MKSILIPTDFSEASYHTIGYGIALAKYLDVKQIVLYHAYQPYVTEDPEYKPVLLSDASLYQSISEEGMKKIKDAFQQNISPETALVCESELNTVEQGITDAAAKYNAGLILMSVTASGTVESLLFGTTAVSLYKQSKVPVFIVPVETSFEPLQKALLALDFKNVETTTPVDSICSVLDAFKAQLDILHVSLHEKETESQFEKSIAFLRSAFNSYNTNYFIEKGDTLTNAINDFADKHGSNIIITVPKKHGWFQNLFRRSDTKAVVLHSHIPVIAIPYN